VGRPDLLGDDQAQGLAKKLFASLREFYLKLPDGVRVHPAHGAGSPCGADIADRLVTTIGYERTHNKALQFTDEAAFVEFALSTAPQNCTWDELLEVWQVADSAPVLHSAWLFDHFYPIFSDPTGPCLEGWTALAGLAAATSRIRVGVLVTGNVHRHPAVLANMAATVDVISGGRLEIGLGAGWNAQECDAYGIPLFGVRERLERLDEAAQVLRLLLTQETSSYDGRYYRLVDARCEPKPVQAPMPPLGIGGSGERRTLRTVARWADHWNYSGGDPDELRHKLEVLRRHADEVGRDVDEVVVSASVSLFDGVPAGLRAAEAMAAAGAHRAILGLPLPDRTGLLHELLAAL
jgi:F420-dependent oxidoreductase-like protein